MIQHNLTKQTTREHTHGGMSDGGYLMTDEEFNYRTALVENEDISAYDQVMFAVKTAIRTLKIAGKKVSSTTYWVRTESRGSIPFKSSSSRDMYQYRRWVNQIRLGGVQYKNCFCTFEAHISSSSIRYDEVYLHVWIDDVLDFSRSHEPEEE